MLSPATRTRFPYRITRKRERERERERAPSPSSLSNSRSVSAPDNHFTLIDSDRPLNIRGALFARVKSACQATIHWKVKAPPASGFPWLRENPRFFIPDDVRVDPSKRSTSDGPRGFTQSAEGRFHAIENPRWPTRGRSASLPDRVWPMSRGCRAFSPNLCVTPFVMGDGHARRSRKEESLIHHRNSLLEAIVANSCAPLLPTVFPYVSPFGHLTECKFVSGLKVTGYHFLRCLFNF